MSKKFNVLHRKFLANLMTNQDYNQKWLLRPIIRRVDKLMVGKKERVRGLPMQDLNITKNYEKYTIIFCLDFIQPFVN